MTWGYVAVAGATLVGGAISANGAKRAGSAVARGADAATAETARQYDTTRADLAPYRTTGTGALNQLGRLFGLPTTTPEQFQAQQDITVGDTALPAGTTTRDIGKGWAEVWNGGNRIGTLRPGGSNGRFLNDTGTDINALRQSTQQANAPQTPAGPDMSAFFQSPGYNFTRSEGTRGIESSFAARGGAASGNALKALAEFNSGLASQEFGNYVNQLGTIAGIGQSSTNQTAAYGADAANSAGRNALYAGEARASGVEGQASAINNGINQLAGAWGYYNRGNKPPPSGYGGTGYGGIPWMTPGYGDGSKRYA